MFIISVWNRTNLGNIITLKRGYDLPQQKREEGKIPIFSSSGLSGFHSTAMVEAPGVITGRYGTIGEVFYSKDAFWPLNTTLYVEDFHGNNPLFIYYLLKTLNWQQFTSASAVPGINRNTVHKADIAIPDLHTQNKIATILNHIDNKIRCNHDINENLEQQARALYKAWFVDYLPFGGAQPNGWKEGKLKDVLTLKRNAIKAGENTTLPYLPIDVIPMNTFALSDVKPNEESQSSLITFDKDDIVIGAMRVYFHRVIIAPFAGITRTTCFTLAPSNKCYLCFGLLCCDQDSSIDYAQSTSKGSTMPYAVWDGGLGDMDIVIPDEDTAYKFNDIVLPMIRSIQASYEENKHLRDLRDALLPRLMSGEIDVSELNL